MKKIIWLASIAGMSLFLLAGCGNRAQDGGQGEKSSADGESLELLENEEGISTVVSIGDAYYYDLMEDQEGNLLALTDNLSEGTSKSDSRVIAWKSSDRGDTWEEWLYQPKELKGDCELQTGTLHSGKDGMEACVVFAEYVEGSAQENVQRLYRITEDTCEEVKADEAFEQLDGMLWNLSFVNSHVLSMAGEKQSVLYDLETSKVVKSISYDAYSVGFLALPDQFLVYGKEIVCCLNADTLKEQEPEEGLKKFIAHMYEQNDEQVFPPMDVYHDVIACVTKEAIFEYRDGKEIQTLSVPDTANSGNAFNGMMPACRGKDSAYYVSSVVAGGVGLQRIEADKGASKQVFTIYTLAENSVVSQIAMLFQQEHPELKVDVRLGMEDEASLTRTDAIKQLNTELLSGEGPDIILMDGLSVEKYADMGLLKPLELKQPKEHYFQNIIETYQKDGELYAVPTGFWLYGVQGSKDMGSSSASPEKMREWMLTHAEQAGLEGYKYTDGFPAYSQYIQFIYDICANGMVRNGTVDEETLKTYMRTCSRLEETSGQDKLDEENMVFSILPGSVEIHFNDEVKVSAGMLCGATDLAALSTECKSEQVEYSIYPMYQPRNIIAINANTNREDTAQAFAEFSLSDSVQKAIMNDVNPVSLETFRRASKGEGMEADEDGLVMEIILGEEKRFNLYRPSDEEIKELEQEIASMKEVFTDDVILRDIVMEELKSYLSQTASLEDATASARNRLDLYLGE